MNCKWIESILAVLILIFTFWWQPYSSWVIGICAVLILLHAVMCRTCHVSHKGMSKSRR